jgi:y4mF family transcriptional regulator
MCTIVHLSQQALTTARTIGIAVKERRVELGLNQGELSLVAGVSRRTIHAIEHGKPTIQLAALVAVLQAVGLELGARPVDRARNRATRIA